MRVAAQLFAESQRSANSTAAAEYGLQGLTDRADGFTCW